jgi:hypothetical protein
MAKRKPRPTPKLPESPWCNCVLLCEDVQMSAHGKHTIERVIETVEVSRLPITIGPFVAYVRISNIYQQQLVRLSLYRAHDNAEVIGLDVELNSNSPLGVTTLIAPTPPIPIDASGRYLFEVRYQGVTMAQTPIQIVEPSRNDDEE